MKVSELTGAALNWAVAYCDEPEHTKEQIVNLPVLVAHTKYSTDWSKGGPIIERERITVISAEYWDTDRGHVPIYAASRGPHGLTESYEHTQMDPTYMIDADDVIHGPTPLIAAMRCYVASKLGNEIDVPVELLGE